jgi:HlyD family secretion protein
MMSKRVIVGIIIAAVVIVGAIFFLRGRGGNGEEEQPEDTPVKVERGALQVTVSASGLLEPLTTVEVKPRAGGEITRIYVEPGDYVHQGDLIAQLDPTQVDLQVTQAQAQLTSARASADQAALQATSQAVTSDTTLVQAQAGLVSANARLRQSEEQYDMTRVSADADVKQARASLESVQAKLAEAKAQHEAQPTLSNAALDQAKADLRSAEENLNELLAGARPQEIARSQAALDSAQARADNARQSLERQQGLLDKGFVSQQAVDDSQQAYETAMATLRSAQADLDLTNEGARTEAIERARASLERSKASLRTAEANMMNIDLRAQQLTSAQAAVRQVEATLRSAEANRAQVQVRAQELAAAGASVREAEASLAKAESGTLEVASRRKQIEIAAASLAQARARLEDVAYDSTNTTIVAPRDGVVLSKPVEEGTVIPGGTSANANAPAIVTIADITEMYVMARIDESDIGGVEEDMRATIEVDVLPNREIRGKVIKVYPEAKAEGDVVYYEVRVQLLDIPQELRPGMTADVTIMIANLEDVLLVPDASVTYRRGQAFVNIKEGDEAVEREIEVGLSDWTNIEVKSGVKRPRQPQR